jgi:hypothetical protein
LGVYFIRRLINLYRLGAGLETMREIWEIQRDIDSRAVLLVIRAPMVVLYRADNRITDQNTAATWPSPFRRQVRQPAGR